MEKTYLALIAAVVIIAAAAALLVPTGDHGTAPEKTTPAPTTTQHTAAPPPTSHPPETTAAPTTNPPETTQPPETQRPDVRLAQEGTLCDLVEVVHRRGWRYEDSNGTWLEVSYSVEGRENVGGVQALKIGITGRGSDVEEQTGYFWLDTTACKIVQLQMPDGTVLTGPLAEQAGTAMLNSALFPVLSTEGIAAEVVSAERAGWQVSWSDLGTKSVGGRSMHVWRFVAVPLPGNQDYGKVSKVTVDVGDLGGGLWMVVYAKTEYPGGGWALLKVTEL